MVKWVSPEKMKGDYREYERERDRIMGESNIDTDKVKRAARKKPVGVKFRRIILGNEGFFRL